MLSWRRAADMPFGMSGQIQSVLIHMTVYIGGGHVDTDSNKFVIMKCDATSGGWSVLPPYILSQFSMAGFQCNLTLVGGYGDGQASKAITVWEPDHKKWTHPYPKMHLARRKCSTAVYNNWLVVAGGVNNGALSSVEVLDADTKQWYAGPPLPVPMCEMKTAIVGDVYYTMGGLADGEATDRVFGASLPALIRHTEPEKWTWNVIHGLQLTGSSPLSLNGALLAVGGNDKDNKAVTDIHLYQPKTGEWLKLGDLPTPRSNCTCTWIASNGWLVAGGWENAEKKMIKRVDVTVY